MQYEKIEKAIAKSERYGEIVDLKHCWLTVRHWAEQAGYETNHCENLRDARGEPYTDLWGWPASDPEGEMTWRLRVYPITREETLIYLALDEGWPLDPKTGMPQCDWCEEPATRYAMPCPERVVFLCDDCDPQRPPIADPEAFFNYRRD